MRVVGFSLVCALLTACSQTTGNYSISQNASPAAIGRIERLPLTQVPFPPGEWVELARDDDEHNASTGIAASHRAYGRVEEGRLAAIFVFWTNNEHIRTYWNVPASCVQGLMEGQKVYASDLHGASGAFDCVLAYPVTYRGPTANSNYSATFYRAARKLGLPATGVGVQVNVASSNNTLIATLIRFPERDGIVGGNWTASQEGPREHAYIQNLLDWAGGFRPAVINGTKGQL